MNDISDWNDFDFFFERWRRNNSATQLKLFLIGTQNSGNHAWLTVRRQNGGRFGRRPETFRCDS